FNEFLADRLHSGIGTRHCLPRTDITKIGQPQLIFALIESIQAIPNGIRPFSTAQVPNRHPVVEHTKHGQIRFLLFEVWEIMVMQTNGSAELRPEKPRAWCEILGGNRRKANR